MVVKRIGIFLFFIFTIYFIFLLRRDIIDNQALRKEKEKNLRKIAQEEKRSEFLDSHFKKLAAVGSKENYDLVEELARVKLGLIKKGEIAYKVVK